MLRLAALPLPIDDAEVHFDRMADRRVSVGRHLHKQHALQDSDVLCSEPESLSLSWATRSWHVCCVLLIGIIHTGWLLSLSTVASISQICCPSRQKWREKTKTVNSSAINYAQLIVSRCTRNNWIICVFFFAFISLIQIHSRAVTMWTEKRTYITFKTTSSYR